MKANSYKAPINSINNRMGISTHQAPVPKSKLLFGSVTDKYPIILDGGKTIIFISDKRNESRIREKYELRMSKRAMK